MEMLPFELINSSWFRFSAYEVFENDKGIYIMPKENSVLQGYVPYTVSEEMLQEFLKYGRSLYEGISQKDKVNIALSFVKKYGLLGLYTKTTYYFDLMDFKNSGFLGGVTHTDENENTKFKALTLSEFISDFFPNEKRQPPEDLDIDNFYLEYYKNYAESVESIAEKALKKYKHFKNIQTFKNMDKDKLKNLGTMEYADIFFDCKETIDMRFNLNYDEKKDVYLSWEIENLSKMIDLIYVIRSVSKSTVLLGECCNCKDPFVTRNLKKKYCTDLCGSNYRMKKLRGKLEE